MPKRVDYYYVIAVAKYMQVASREHTIKMKFDYTANLKGRENFLLLEIYRRFRRSFMHGK